MRFVWLHPRHVFATAPQRSRIGRRWHSVGRQPGLSSELLLEQGIHRGASRGRHSHLQFEETSEPVGLRQSHEQLARRAQYQEVLQRPQLARS